MASAQRPRDTLLILYLHIAHLQLASAISECGSSDCDVGADDVSLLALRRPEDLLTRSDSGEIEPLPFPFGFTRVLLDHVKTGFNESSIAGGQIESELFPDGEALKEARINQSSPILGKLPIINPDGQILATWAVVSTRLLIKIELCEVGLYLDADCPLWNQSSVSVDQLNAALHGHGTFEWLSLLPTAYAALKRFIKQPSEEQQEEDMKREDIKLTMAGGNVAERAHYLKKLNESGFHFPPYHKGLHVRIPMMKDGSLRAFVDGKEILPFEYTWGSRVMINSEFNETLRSSFSKDDRLTIERPHFVRRLINRLPRGSRPLDEWDPA
eukprot:gnl/TRDRNA2_/TRDRNA2_194942_c0_seq1.p1 gnl/TRDRNA2_/TRDRNA2_194942_c0~~gnl/TRDRNA2_/TRDRNA2_194942_c0_seq1.p1  ORF type:complete len:327 (-),score=27.57 gnl/TRDRNA2_/TRDRNA2_194942_c0_seq1:59-1039(-)